VSTPTVTAVVTAYNAEDYVAETLRSLLAQTRPPDEIVVIDDGSTDGTPDVLATFGDAIRVVRQPNAGHTGALNRGWQEARGEYVAQCDADDIWEPDKLARQLAALAAHPQIDVAFCAVQVFGAMDGILELPDAAPGIGLVDAHEFARSLFRNNFILPSSTLVRRALYDRIGAFDASLPFVDYDFWLRALRAGAVYYYDPEPGVRYRRHEAQMTAGRLGVVRSLHQVRTRNAALIGDRRLIDTVASLDLFRIGRLLVDVDPAAARSAFAEATRRTTRDTLPVGARAAAWVGLLSLPPRWRRRLEQALVGASRRVDALRGGRPATLP
jgi:glycosyltransferase involved in cell wall biosynthesis